MIGHIESYNSDTQSGVIKSEDKFFAFDLKGWASDVPPDQGDDVYFDAGEDNTAINVKLMGAYLEPPKAVKSKYIAGILGLLLGFAGAHRFYLGFYKLGLAQIAVSAFTIGYGAVWGFVEAFLIFTGHIYKDAKGRPLK